MTKFILHGGMTSIRNDVNKKFYEEIIKDIPENPKILICLFSIEENRWEEEYGYQKNNFIENLGEQGFEFQLAKKEKFLEQLKWADAIHFRGGSTLLLLEVLNNFSEFKNSLLGKTVSGSSAGACFLVDNFYENDIQEIHKGLGIISINLITHYGSDSYPEISAGVFEKLKSSGNKELVLIQETEYKIFKL